MEVKEIESKKLFKEYEIQIPYAEVDQLIDTKINKLLPTVTLPGFRTGKAPLAIVRKKYENNVLSEVIEDIVKEKTQKLLTDQKLKAFRQPRVDIKKYEKNKPVQISIKIDLDPDIKISSFDKLQLTKRSIKLDTKTIDKNYDSFIESQKHYHKIKEQRPVEMTDKIITNITTENNLVPDFLKNQNNLSIITDSDYQILPDISKKLIQKKVKVGDKIKLQFDLKEVLKKKDNNIVEFLIEILSIEKVHRFEVTKEFLEKNNIKDEKELKNNLKNNLIKQYEDFLKQIEQKELMDLLESKNDFDVPEGILDDEFKLIWQRLEQAKKNNQLDEDDKNLKDDQLKARYKKIAFRRVKLAILMQHIANKNKISVSEKELTEGMLNYASQYPGKEKEILDYFKKNPSSIESIRGPIFEQKIIEHIMKEVKTKEEQIDIEGFKKLQEKTFSQPKEH